MTNSEMLELVCTGKTPISVSMSKVGIFLTVDGAASEITGDQAEILLEILPQIGGLSDADRASLIAGTK